MNEIASQNELNKKLHEMGFENEREYQLYIKIKKSLQQPVATGVAS